VPGETAFTDAVRRLLEAEPTTEMPTAETQREADLFDVLSLIFLEPRQWFCHPSRLGDLAGRTSAGL
jgi:negative regulator of sigma E activity